jgi:hypothetical protein
LETNAVATACPARDVYVVVRIWKPAQIGGEVLDRGIGPWYWIVVCWSLMRSHGGPGGIRWSDVCDGVQSLGIPCTAEAEG